MDFYERMYLPVLSFDEDRDVIGRDILRAALCERPCNIVLVETGGKLSGIITRGDISRARDAGLPGVPVNRNFAVQRGRNYMEARNLFRERDRVNEIPVTDEEGRLLGICTRNDDLLYLAYSSPWEENRYIAPFLEHLDKARFVRPNRDDTRRKKIFDRWISEFEKRGVSCEQIDFTEIPEKQKEDIAILLVDEEMHNGAAAVIESLDHGVYRLPVAHTFREYERIMSEHAYDELVNRLSDSGIRIYNMYFSKDEGTPGRKRLFDGMRNWLKMPEARGVNPHVVPSCAQGFFGELNTGTYAAEVGKLYFRLESSSVYTRMKDVRSRYLNIVNGERVTIGQPEEAERTIWFFGPCFILGGFVEDKHTIESMLQEKLNAEGFSARVVNCGCYESLYQRMIHITSTPMKPGDILVMNLEDRPYAGTENIELVDLLDQNDVPCEWLLDLPTHCNYKVNRIYAGELYRRMIKDGVFDQKPDTGVKRTLLSRAQAVNSLYLDLHFYNYQPQEGEVTGGVVMHANPFTYGHRYLIETASKQVDRLIVLLLEDETGVASFAERYAMAVEGTADLPNVRIVPGGPFQGTRNVFKEYFVRVEPADMEESARAVMLIYAEIIAKRLGITKRFIGEEQNPKMQFFNVLMKEIMTANGIEVIEIPRAKAKENVISASAARKAAEEGDEEALLANLPETSVRFFVGP